MLRTTAIVLVAASSVAGLILPALSAHWSDAWSSHNIEKLVCLRRVEERSACQQRISNPASSTSASNTAGSRGSGGCTAVGPAVGDDTAGGRCAAGIFKGTRADLMGVFDPECACKPDTIKRQLPSPRVWHTLKERIDGQLKHVATNLTIDSGERNTSFSPKHIQEWLNVRGQLDNWAEKEPERRYAGFYRHPQMFLHSWMLALLGALVVRLDVMGWCFVRFLLATTLWGVTRSVHFWRAFTIHTDPDRMIFSYLHWDVSKLSFVLDQVLFWLSCYFIASLCIKWQRERASMQKELGEAVADVAPKRPDEFEYAKGKVFKSLATLNEKFKAWQIASAALALTFLYLTVVYWRLTTVDRDMRSHGKRGSFGALIFLACASSEQQPAALELLREIHPVGMWRTTVSVILAIGSFVLPAIRTVMELL